MNGGFCTACGTAAAADARFCGRCGKPLGGGTAPAGAAPSARAEAPQQSAPEAAVFELRPLVVRDVREFLLCLFTLGIAWLCYWAARLGRRYVITTQRIEVIEGVFTKRRTSLDLFRIEDFEVVEPFFLRLRGAGNLRVWSMDRSEPEMSLDAVPDVHTVYERLRDMTRDERGRQRVRVVEGM